jgi:ABC-type xylose transport system permease subunit
VTWEEARDKPDVVSGIFLINNIPAPMLFDYGATFSFISAIACTLWNLVVEDLDDTFEVETANGVTFMLGRVVSHCTLKLEGYRFPVRLFVFTLGGFDVVMGMDWLVQVEASIVCKQQKVCLTAPDESRITIYDDKEVRMPGIISMLKAGRYMRRGCQAYLAYVIAEKTKTRDLVKCQSYVTFQMFFQMTYQGCHRISR